MLALRSTSSHVWLETVLGDFDAFIVDHAACERKAAATGMSLVVKYPDRSLLVEPMIAFAREELEHFHIVVKLAIARGLTLTPDYRDEYVRGLRSQVRSGPERLLLDRLLVAGIVEARGCERLGMVAEALSGSDDELLQVYRDLARAESRHHALFFRLARHYFDEVEVRERADALLDFEADLLARLPVRAAVH